MQEWFAQYMQVNVIGERSDFFNWDTEIGRGNKLIGSGGSHTKAAMIIADIGNFNIYFFESQII